MKLDGELHALADGESACCQTLEKKATCKSVESNKIVNEMVALGPGEKLDKENQNGTSCGLKGNERDVNCMSSQINRDGLWNVLEFDCSTSDDSTNANEDEVRDFGEPYTHSSAQIGLYQNDMAESELPEIVVCYKENHDNIVKDICIDQGVTSLGKILFGDGLDKGKGLHNFLPPEEDESVSLVKGNTDSVMSIPDDSTPSAEQDCSQDSADQCASVDPDQISSSHNKDSAMSTTSNLNSAEKDCCEELNNVTDAIEEKHMPGVIDPELFNREDEVNKQYVQNPYEEAMPKNSTLVSAVDELITSLTQASADEESNTSHANDTSYDSKVEDGSITFNFDSSALVSSDKEEKSQHEHLVTQNTPKCEAETADCHAFSNQNRHCPGESSFSVTGPLSGLITYSGPIAYSGSCSLRSESSTTSTRSFAFPVLQGEWNSSPVRMRKAERRKHKGCLDGLLCCRF